MKTSYLGTTRIRRTVPSITTVIRVTHSTMTADPAHIGIPICSYVTGDTVYLTNVKRNVG